MEHLIERLRSAEGGGLPGLAASGLSRSGSLRSSWCGSNRGSIYNSSDDSGGPNSINNLANLQMDQLKDQGSSSTDRASNDTEEADGDEQVVVVTNVCSSCQAENQIRQAISVQQARQR